MLKAWPLVGHQDRFLTLQSGSPPSPSNQKTRGEGDRYIHRLFWQDPTLYQNGQTKAVVPRWATWSQRFEYRCSYPLVLERLLLLAPPSAAAAATERLGEDERRSLVDDDTEDHSRLPVVRLRRFTLHWLYAMDDLAWATLADKLGVTDRLLMEKGIEQHFSTFERAVNYTAHSLNDDTCRFFLRIDEALGVTTALPKDCQWPRDAGLEAVKEWCRHRIVYTAALRRVIFAAAAARWLVPSTRTGNDDATYAATLFMDTHLDLFAAVARYGGRCEDETFFFAVHRTVRSSTLLDTVYPLPQRVICYEELPDMAPLLLLSDLVFDAGRNKKPHRLARVIAHIFLCKQMNQICHLRHLVQTIRKCSDDFPEVGSLLMLVIYVALQGNLPGTHYRSLSMGARLRVHLSLAPNPLGQSNAQGTQGGSDCNLDQVLTFINKTRHVTLFLMHEVFLAVCEGDWVVDTMFSSTSAKWLDYKQVVRLANTEIRQELEGQTRSETFFAPFDWTALEKEKRQPIDTLHTLGLGTCKKIKKGRAEEIICKKMISVETPVLNHHIQCAIEQRPATVGRLLAWAEVQEHGGPGVTDELFSQAERLVDAAFSAAMRKEWDFFMRQDAKCTLAVFTPTRLVRQAASILYVIGPLTERVSRIRTLLHETAQAAALRSMRAGAGARDREVIELRWLQPLQIRRDHAEAVRQWVHDYYVFDQPDNKYKDFTLAMGKQSLYSHLVVKLYFRLFSSYRREALIVRPYTEALRVMDVLRERLQLLPGDTTPEALGRSLYCSSCHRWAVPLKDSPLWIQCQHDRRSMAAGVAHEVRQASGARVTLTSFLHAPLEIGASRCRIDLRDGERYCLSAKQPKARLLEQKTSAHAQPEGPESDHGEDDSDRDEHDEDHLEDSDDGADDLDEGSGIYESPTNARPNKLVESQHLFELDEHGMPMLLRLPAEALTSERIVSALQGSNDPRDKDDDNHVDAKTTTVPEKKVSTFLRKMTTRAINDIALPILALYGTSCSKTPLLSPNLVGLWYWRAGTLVGHCVYCGDLTTVENEKITNHGLSCMNHPHAEFPADHPHTLAFTRPSGSRSARRTTKVTGDTNPTTKNGSSSVWYRDVGTALEPTTLTERLMKVGRHPMLLDHLVPCAHCRRHQTRTVIRVFDANLATFEVPLCKPDLGALRSQLPALQIGRVFTQAVEPARLDLIARELATHSPIRQ